MQYAAGILMPNFTAFFDCLLIAVVVILCVVLNTVGLHYRRCQLDFRGAKGLTDEPK